MLPGMEPSPTANWRDSARPARFFIVDAKAAFPILLFLMHIRLWTFIVAVVAMLFFTMLNKFGYSIEVFLRILRSFFGGNRKVAIPWWMN
jgi:intracellular multiplication protein IcmT